MSPQLCTECRKPMTYGARKGVPPDMTGSAGCMANGRHIEAHPRCYRAAIAALEKLGPVTYGAGKYARLEKRNPMNESPRETRIRSLLVALADHPHLLAGPNKASLVDELVELLPREELGALLFAGAEAPLFGQKQPPAPARVRERAKPAAFSKPARAPKPRARKPPLAPGERAKRTVGGPSGKMRPRGQDGLEEVMGPIPSKLPPVPVPAELVDKKILEFAKSGALSTGDVVVGLSLTKAVALTALSRLVERGALTRTGKAKATRYALAAPASGASEAGDES